MAKPFSSYLPFGLGRSAQPVAKAAPNKPSGGRGGSSFKEMGTTGTPMSGGYVFTREKNASLAGHARYETYSDIMANVSIVAAGLRFFLGLAARPTWKIEPAKDQGDTSSDAAKAAAEFVDSILNGMDTSMTRIVRRSGMYRFYGFGIHEWTAKRRDDGLIGIESIEVRPCHTIDRWDVDDNGGVKGVYQSNWQGADLYIPRRKFIYLLDDTLTDSPEGLGLFRHMAEPVNRLREYERLEGQGYERDLRGIPVGRAPYAEIQAKVREGVLTDQQGKEMTAALESFIRLQAKDTTTGLMLDSSIIRGEGENQEVLSSTPKWDMDLLSASGGSFAEIAKAIERCRYDLAMILGTENLLIGSTDSGSRALSDDKSRNLYLQANSTVQDIAQSFRVDLISAIWALNGLPAPLMPSITPEDVSFQSVEMVAKTLRDMAAAGAVLSEDDPVIQDVRDMMGVSGAPDRGETDDEDEMLRRTSEEARRQGRESGRTPEQDPTDPNAPEEER